MSIEKHLLTLLREVDRERVSLRKELLELDTTHRVASRELERLSKGNASREQGEPAVRNLAKGPKQTRLFKRGDLQKAVLEIVLASTDPLDAPTIQTLMSRNGVVAPQLRTIHPTLHRLMAKGLIYRVYRGWYFGKKDAPKGWWDQ